MRVRSCSLLVLLSCVAFSVTSLFSQTPAKHLLTADDFLRAQQVRDPQVAPDGKWVAYTVTSTDREADKRRTSIWMVNWEGAQDLQLTFGPNSDSSPRWSPDGKYLAFLSSPEDGKAQIWLLDRRGGSARALTSVKGDIDSYSWSPDGKRLLLAMQVSDEDASETPGGKPKTPKPIAMDRYHFKQDLEGYLTGLSPQHLYLFDVESKKLEALTGVKPEERNFEEGNTSWSPDGSQIAFVSNHAKDPDQTGTDDIFLVDARVGATPRLLLTTFSPNWQRLRWSPDGKTLAFLQGSEPKFNAYNQDRLAVVAIAGSTPRVLTEKLDRAASQIEFSRDGSSVMLLVEDDQRA